jgi:hypothetical protein
MEDNGRMMGIHSRLVSGILLLGTVVSAQTLPRIEAAAILAHVKVLASDQYEGRAPGTKGEELTVTYLVDQFKKLGLKPGNTDGTYTQNVPLVGITPDPSMTLTFKKGAEADTLKFKDDFVAWTKRVSDSAALDDSELVFVGYGVEAPEFKWDDYKGVDLKGKTMVVLINDPPLPDEKLFGGRAMTYYGRWTYKFETGAKKGAAGILIVHETIPAGYPFSVIQSSSGERFDLVTPDKNMWRASVEGWISLDRAKQLFAKAGQDFDALKARAATRDFKPVPPACRSRTSCAPSTPATSSRSWRDPTRSSKTSTSYIRPTGITWASGRTSRATRSTTARSTTPLAPGAFSRSPARLRR